nr:GDP-L-fucose synthase [uncultured Desulfobulbus sp.]
MPSPNSSLLTPNSRIFLAGHRGMVGSAILRKLTALGYENIITRTHKELDLTQQQAVREFFQKEKIDYVVLAAAKVGGIHANNTYPADFITQNLQIQTNIIHEAFMAGVKDLLFLGSSCIYPKLAPQPLKEEYLLTGELEPTNDAYAIAKIAGIKMCEAYNRQHSTRYIAVMPTNLYGPGDNFHPENSHVLPALILRFHQAKLKMRSNQEEVVVWGTGKPMREFLHVDDMAEGCVYLMQLDQATLKDHLLSYPKPCFVNLGTGLEVSIRELAETVKEVVGFQGKLTFDTSKPDGTPRKLLDVSRLHHLGWQHKIELRQGIEDTYRWLLENEDALRI